LVKRQDAAVAQTTFYRVAGLKSLANHQLRSYHTHKVWCGGADEGLIEYGKVHEWFINYFDSVRATGAQDSRRILSNIIVYNYDTTHLQENPQRLR